MAVIYFEKNACCLIFTRLWRQINQITYLLSALLKAGGDFAVLCQSGESEHPKLRLAERPQSLDIATNVPADAILVERAATVATQRAHALKPRCDIVEQSLRAANLLADYSTSLPSRTATNAPSSSIAPSVSHPSDSSSLEIGRRRLHDDTDNNNSAALHCGRHSLSDIVTPTSDVTTASSPSESLSQVSIASISSLVCYVPLVSKY